MALPAVQKQKREALPVQDQREHLLAQARSLADKMDQQVKIAQEANNKREQLREELVTVYVHLEKLPPELLPVPKAPVATSGDGPGGPAQTPEALLAMMAFTKTLGPRARRRTATGRRKPFTNKWRPHRKWSSLEEDDLQVNTDNGQTAGEDASMQDVNEEQPKEDPSLGEPDAANGDSEARKRIRAALEQRVDPLGSSSGSMQGPIGTSTMESFLRPKAKAAKVWHRDLEVRARNALLQTCQLHWVKAHLTRQAVDEGSLYSGLS
eukprot:6490715-Amphidinium_carterae.2